MKANLFRHILNWWPPFLFTGIRVVRLDDDFRFARVELRQHWYNRNYVGTHFGGSLFAMTDPFWMVLLMNRLGDGYRVWDQAGEIRFEKPGRGTVHAQFALDDATVDAIRDAAASGGKVLHWFETAILDGDGEVVARVRKQVYVRRKPGRPVGDGPSEGRA